MPLVDENRSLVKYGLRLMRLGFKNKGLRRLAELSGVDYNNITSTNVAFSLVPRINAAGRLVMPRLELEHCYPMTMMK